MSVSAFRIKEAERKMQMAALSMNYEAAIVLRDEMLALRAAQAAIPEDTVDRKVVDFKTRQPVAQAEGGEEQSQEVSAITPEAEEFVADAEEVALAKFILEGVEKGNFTGMVVFVGHREPDDEIDVVTSWPTSVALENMQKFIGAFEQTKHDIMMLAMDEYEEEVGYED